MRALVPSMLAPIEVGPDTDLVFYDAVPSLGDVSGVEFFVPPYMGDPRDLEVLGTMPRLSVVQLLTAGYESVLPWLPKGVTLCNAEGVHDASTSELAVGLMLASLRGIDAAARAMTTGTWDHRPLTSLADRSVLIVGSGGVGRAIHDRLVPFEVTIRMTARSAREGIFGPEELPELLAQSDIVVVAVPLDDSTRSLVDEEFLSQMVDGSLLVNVSRGEVVNTVAMLKEVDRLRFALDVTDPEPLPTGHPLWSATNVLITPHVGGDTSAFLPRARGLVSAQLDRWAHGDQLEAIVVPDAIRP